MDSSRKRSALKIGTTTDTAGEAPRLVDWTSTVGGDLMGQTPGAAHYSLALSELP
jgi:hypothetical protein